MRLEGPPGRIAHAEIRIGNSIVMLAEDQFYGDRSGRIEDPFGHVWIISTHIEDVSPAEMQRRFDEMMSRKS